MIIKNRNKPWFWLIITCGFLAVALFAARFIDQVLANRSYAWVIVELLCWAAVSVGFSFFIITFFQAGTRQRKIVSILVWVILALIWADVLSTLSRSYGQVVMGWPFGIPLPVLGGALEIQSIPWTNKIGLFWTKQELWNHLFWWVIFSLPILTWYLRRRKVTNLASPWLRREKIMASLLYYGVGFYIADGLARGYEGNRTDIFGFYGPNPMNLRGPYGVRLSHSTELLYTLINYAVWLIMFSLVQIGWYLWQRKKRRNMETH